MVKRLPAMRETQVPSWVGKIPWRRKWQPTPVLLPGKFHGQRSLVGYSPLGRKESDMTERLHFHFHGYLSAPSPFVENIIFCSFNSFCNLKKQNKTKQEQQQQLTIIKLCCFWVLSSDPLIFCPFLHQYNVS